jgi:hypothetical protein
LRLLAGEPARVDDPWETVVDRIRAREVLDRLGAHQRAALTLRHLDGLPVPEVARHLDRTLQGTWRDAGEVELADLGERPVPLRACHAAPAAREPGDSETPCPAIDAAVWVRPLSSRSGCSGCDAGRIPGRSGAFLRSRSGCAGWPSAVIPRTRQVT